MRLMQARGLPGEMVRIRVLRDVSLLLLSSSLHVRPHPRATGTLAPLAHSRR
jgi:hypothetical protein